MTPSLTRERLWSLLPTLHRVRDAGRDELQELISLFAEQFAALEENSAQLYDDLFIETCADWVAPYIGDLIGYRTLHGGVLGAELLTLAPTPLVSLGVMS